MERSKDYKEKSNIIACTVSGTKYTLYTCPVQCRARVPFISLTDFGGAVTVNLELYRAASTSSFYLLGSKSMATGDRIEISNSYLVLEPGDKLEITATGTTPRVDAICTVEEIFRPVG